MEANIFRDIVDPADLICVKLMQLVRACKCPLYAYDRIMEWAAESTLSGHKFEPAFTKREYKMKEFTEKFELQGAYPFTIPVKLYPNNRLAHVVFHDIEAAIFSLLTDSNLMQSQNLVFPNPDDPRDGPPDGGYSHYRELHTGKF